MEEKLRALVEKIERSSLSNEDKEALYAQMSESLHSVVVPVLLKYVPKEKLDALANNPPQDMAAAYVDLVKNSIQDGKALQEVSFLVNDVLVDVETGLAKGGIV